MRTGSAAGLSLVLGILAGMLIEAWFWVSPTPEARVASDSPPPAEAAKVEATKEVRTKVNLEPIKVVSKKLEMTSPVRQPVKEKAPLQEVAMHSGLLDLGQRWLEGQNGSFPSLIVHYQGGIGFAAYADYMRRLGGRFFVRDLDVHKLRGEIDIAGNRLIPVDIGSLGSLSPRSRDLSDEPGLYRFIAKAQESYGAARYGVILLVPASVDAVVIGGIEESLRKLGQTPQQFLVFEGRYQRKGDDLVLELLTGRTKSKEAFAVNLALNLSEAARLGLR